MRRWQILIGSLCLPLLLFVGRGAAIEDHDCSSKDVQKRIIGCTELIETPNLPAGLLSEAYSRRALAYSLGGRYQQAIKDYDRSLGLVPNNPVTLNNRAWAYFKWGRPSEGMPDVQMSLRIDPTSPHAFDTRAHIRQWLDQPDGALRDYEIAMGLDPHMVKLYQCGLQAHGLYDGPADGIYTGKLRAALKVCIGRKQKCDPLPPDEECKVATS